MTPEQKQLIREKFETKEWNHWSSFQSKFVRLPDSTKKEIADFWLNELDLTIKQTEERIEKGIEMLTHYYRSKYSSDCSRGETEEEKSTEMLEKQNIIALIRNSQNLTKE